VLDFSALWAGPLCAALLADAGADVIKIESARRLDGARAGAPLFYDGLNARKRSAVLDFASARDAALLAALLASADLVVESARPRALAQLGIDAERFVAARAGRVWLSITGYGRGDAAPGRVAFGDDAAVAAGAAHAVADDAGPLFCADAIADRSRACTRRSRRGRAGDRAAARCSISRCATSPRTRSRSHPAMRARCRAPRSAPSRASATTSPRSRHRARAEASAHARAPGADTDALRVELAC
jgi:hypothetical protein